MINLEKMKKKFITHSPTPHLSPPDHLLFISKKITTNTHLKKFKTIHWYDEMNTLSMSFFIYTCLLR